MTVVPRRQANPASAPHYPLINTMNKKILVVACAVFFLTLFTAGAVYAYFTGVAVNANNIFSSGTLELKLSKDNSQYTDSVAAAFGGTELVPGACAPLGTLYMKNTGSVNGNHLDIAFVNTEAAFAQFLRIETFKWDNTDLSIADTNNNGFPDLADLAQHGITNKPMTDHEVHAMQIKVCLDASTGNDQQAKTNAVTLNVTLEQGPHMP